MAAQKRSLDSAPSSHKSKKLKASTSAFESALPDTSSLTTDDIDFPRGGGTSYTPLEVKTIRAEALKEADRELFKEAQDESKKSKKRKRKSNVGPSTDVSTTGKNDRIRIEHLNYKRMNVGMKIFGQIMSIQPFALIVSLPNQLFGHVPITNVSSQLTSLLERAENEDEEDDEFNSKSGVRVPCLSDIFCEGQYVRAVVTALHTQGHTDIAGIGRTRDDAARASKRVELSLYPEKVNAGVKKTDLVPAFTLTAEVRSVEDHGYQLGLGVQGMAGILTFKDTKGLTDGQSLIVGQLVDVTVQKQSSNGRTCHVTNDPDLFLSSSLTEITSVTSVLPGTAVLVLITSVHATGLNVQVLGFFDGTIDRLHLPRRISDKTHKVGKKIKARVLYNYSTAPPRFALALNEHIAELGTLRTKSGFNIQEAYPVGKIIEDAKILRVEPERGVDVEVEDGLKGFAHISHISDEHLPTVSASSPWKPDSIHRARVIGYFPFDGVLQLSLKPSVLDQQFFQVDDIKVGGIVKGTIKKLADNGLFVSLSGNIDGVVWPNHYADIVLKHPAKRFKVGTSVKCRVLVVDTVRKRLSLTHKKTLLESTLPIVSSIEDAKIGLVTHAVVFKVLTKHLMVEFYNNVKATVPIREVSEVPVNLSDAFSVGKIVKVRIIDVDQEHGRIVASIKKSSASQSFNADISGVGIGDIVNGTVSEIHSENVVLALQPSEVRAFLSLNNLSNHRGVSLAQLSVDLSINDKLEELVVVTRNTEKNFVIVATRPKGKANVKGSLSMDKVVIGQVVSGRVTRRVRQGTLIKLPSRIGGLLHPTDATDDYEMGIPFPATDSVLKATVVGIDATKKQLSLSTRPSKIYSDESKPVVDRVVDGINDIHVGETLRGFIKSITDHGLFVTIARNVDARVQIRELFDDYVKDWQERFRTDQVVKGRILSVDINTKKVEMTLRSNDFARKSTFLSYGDLQKGQKISGTIKKIEEYGLFIQIESSKLSGLCHKSELSDNKDADVTVALGSFREGDRVKAVILDVVNRRISLSCKPSHFSEEDFADQDSDEAEAVEQLGVVDEDADDDEQEDSQDGLLHHEANDSSDDNSDDGVMDVDSAPTHLRYQLSSAPKETTANSGMTLKMDAGFNWYVKETPPKQSDDGSDGSENTDDEDQPSKKRKRRRKDIEQDFTADMHTKAPESTADFERLLLGSPNSSYLWVQYMAFFMQLSEIDKARETARRALSTINFREEQEKLNVWIALLNLENLYGTDETLEATFKEAARANDSKTIHLRLASIFDASKKFQQAEDQHKRTCKKFGRSSKVWTLFAEFYLRRDDIENSRNLLPRSLQSLEKRKHLKTISRFAQLEYKMGDPERGKTLFEGIVDSHPKRWDIWSIYMDMEVGQSNIQSLRSLFDRVLAFKMTSHKAKSFFKKWLELERRLGDEDGATMVKQKAVEWTQRANPS
ncbi:nucleic acid-binding protein [Guyanagaster necrorhizus]|uniref:Nucleic acid-binding protein n=1 Tax=Guyanagaster necrorhizus TaxID=856835 RepID=A0A9P8AXN0_9AGAR|nr:nucleic acid-binding protein [Guyanagaster necrorhizus MCA 3950]KAG7450112.1 nucleic acid-binding protein [Guyanagaster necrorhizus MCA 3950]